MLPTLSGRTRLSKDLQPLNALFPMLVTPLGITMSAKDSQSANAMSQIIFVPSFME